MIASEAAALHGSASAQTTSLTFMVTALEGDRAEVLAAAANVSVAWAAFEAAIPTRTEARIILHQGARVLGQHPAPGGLSVSVRERGANRTNCRT